MMGAPNLAILILLKCRSCDGLAAKDLLETAGDGLDVTNSRVKDLINRSVAHCVQ